MTDLKLRDLKEDTKQSADPLSRLRVHSRVFVMYIVFINTNQHSWEVLGPVV